MLYENTRFVLPTSNPGVSQERWDRAFLTDAEYEEKYGKQDATENKENNHERNNE